MKPNPNKGPIIGPIFHDPKKKRNFKTRLDPIKPIVPTDHLLKPSYTYGYYRCKYCNRTFEGENAESQLYAHLHKDHGRSYN